MQTIEVASTVMAPIEGALAGWVELSCGLWKHAVVLPGAELDKNYGGVQP